MSKINDILNEGHIFFLATVDKDQPHLRPLGAHMEMDGKVIFGVGDFKDVYKQLVNNPKCEIVCLLDEGVWLRYTGRAVFETDNKYAEAMLNNAPHLRKLYNPETGYRMMCFHLEDAIANTRRVMSDIKDIQL